MMRHLETFHEWEVIPCDGKRYPCMNMSSKRLSQDSSIVQGKPVFLTGHSVPF
jgi:hypothetical protein